MLGVGGRWMITIIFNALSFPNRVIKVEGRVGSG